VMEMKSERHDETRTLTLTGCELANIRRKMKMMDALLRCMTLAINWKMACHWPPCVQQVVNYGKGDTVES
jgi:hypothetical protein